MGVSWYIKLPLFVAMCMLLSGNFVQYTSVGSPRGLQSHPGVGFSPEEAGHTRREAAGNMDH